MKFLLYSLIVITLLGVGDLSFAQTTPAPPPTTYQPLEPIPGASPEAYTSFAGYLSNIYRIAIVIGALIAVVTLTLSGTRYMLSDSFTDKSDAKGKIANSMWGLAILVGSFLILYTINPNLLSFKLFPTDSGIQVSTGSQQPLRLTVPKQETTAECELAGRRMEFYSNGAWACVPR